MAWHEPWCSTGSLNAQLAILEKQAVETGE